MILVVGATGTVGSALVAELRSRKTGFRVFVRNLPRAKEHLGPEIDGVEGELDDHPSLAAALVGVESIFLLSPPDPRQVEQQGHAVDMAREAGVRHVVKLSCLGADADSQVSLARWHAQTEEQIQDLGLRFTHLRPHYFMQNLLGFAAEVKERNCLSAPMRDGKISLVDARDVASVAAAVLVDTGQEDHVYEITGPQALSFAEITEQMTQVLDRAITYHDVPPREAEEAMLRQGTPNWMAEAVVDLYGIFATGRASATTEVVRRVTGRSPRTLRQFLQDHQDLF